MMLQDKIAVIYGAGAAIGGSVDAPLRARGPEFFSEGASGHSSKRSLRKSYRLADPPRRRSSTLSTNKLSTSIYSS
jgi:hypothetical protein